MPRSEEDGVLLMNHDIARWETELLAEYKPNSGEAYREAKRLRFRFSNSDELPLKVYLRQKAALMSGIETWN